MNAHLDLQTDLSAELVPGAEIAAEKAGPWSKVPLSGKFNVEHWRDGKLIGVHDFPNGITIEGKNKLLDVAFHAQTAITTWYIGLIDFNGFTALAEGDIYDNIDQAGNGWDEYKNYKDKNNADSTTTRPEWQENAASAKTITNTTTAIFEITGTTEKVKGIFVVGGTNAQTKGDHAPTVNFLWATALFTSGDLSVTVNDQIKITYTIST